MHVANPLVIIGATIIIEPNRPGIRIFDTDVREDYLHTLIYLLALCVLSLILFLVAPEEE